MDPNGTFLIMLFMWASDSQYSPYLVFDFRSRISSCLHQYLYSQYRTIYTPKLYHPTSVLLVISTSNIELHVDWAWGIPNEEASTRNIGRNSRYLLREKPHSSKAERTSNVILPINLPVFLMKMWSFLRKRDIHGFSAICFSRKYNLLDGFCFIRSMRRNPENFLHELSNLRCLIPCIPYSAICQGRSVNTLARFALKKVILP